MTGTVYAFNAYLPPYLTQKPPQNKGRFFDAFHKNSRTLRLVELYRVFKNSSIEKMLFERIYKHYNKYKNPSFEKTGFWVGFFGWVFLGISRLKKCFLFGRIFPFPLLFCTLRTSRSFVSTIYVSLPLMSFFAFPPYLFTTFGSEMLRC